MSAIENYFPLSLRRFLLLCRRGLFTPILLSGENVAPVHCTWPYYNYSESATSLCGTLQASLIFWKKIVGDLHRWGFTMNPYDRCVVNKHIQSSKVTVLWHFDDLKISHRGPKVVTTVINLLQAQYGKTYPLTVRHGNLHDYLGMQINYETTKLQIRL